jgi:nicotinamide mononucleotide transporter
MDYLQQHWLEWFGVITGLLFLYLEIKQYPIMWIVGILTSAVYIVVYLQASFYAYGLLNVYYVAISVYGLWLWMRGDNPNKTENKSSQHFRHIYWQLGLMLGIITVMLYAGIYWALVSFTDSVMPWAEATGSALSIVATWMLAKRFIEHWFVWIVVNIVSVSMFVSQGMYPTALLFFCYVFLSSIGYVQWRKFTKHELQ